MSFDARSVILSSSFRGIASSVAIFFMTGGVSELREDALTLANLRVLQSLYCHGRVPLDGLEKAIVRGHLLRGLALSTRSHQDEIVTRLGRGQALAQERPLQLVSPVLDLHAVRVGSERVYGISERSGGGLGELGELGELTIIGGLNGGRLGLGLLGFLHL
jgi:hypothetical protein